MRSAGRSLGWSGIFDTGSLPPVLVDGRWVDSLDAPDVVCCLPCVRVLLETWRRGVRCLRGLLPGWGNVSAADSGVALGSAFASSGCLGRVALSDQVAADLRSQLGVARSLGSLRLPHFWSP